MARGTLMAMAGMAAYGWGNPMEMVADAFGANSAGAQRSRSEIARRKKAAKARKSAKAARRRNRHG